VARGEITIDQAATYKLYALFGARSEIPAQFISAEPVPGDGTMLFLEAMKDWDRLSPATKNLVNDFITPKEFTPTVQSAVPAARSSQAAVAPRTPTPASVAKSNVAPTAIPTRLATATRVAVAPPKLPAAPVLHNTIVITSNATGAPSFAVLSSNLPPTSTITYAPVRLEWTGAPLTQSKNSAKLQPMASRGASALANDWGTLVETDFEAAFPPPTCIVTDATRSGGFERYWGQDTVHAYSGTRSIWPARAGANGLDPATSNYANNMDSWFVCGPYDFTNAQNLQARFLRWVEDIPGTWWNHDYVGIVYSTTGNLWDGVLWWGVQREWVQENWLFSQFQGQPLAGQPQVWVAFVFRENGDGLTGKGVWIDDFRATRTASPADLAVQITTQSNTAFVSLPLTYTLTITNSASTTATGVVVTDTLAASMTFSAATSTQGSCGRAGSVVTCTLGAIAPGASVSANIVVTPTAVGVVSNQANVAGNEPDPNVSNNAAVLDIEVKPFGVDLVGGMRASSANANVGKPITYTINVTNTSPLAANGTTLNFRSSALVFADARFARVTSSQGACAKRDDAATSCALNALNASTVATVTVVITPTVLFPAIITNTVQITNTVPPELNAADNAITQTTSIALPRKDILIGRCALTEYYDTPQGNFRVHYTRSLHNKPGWNEEQDCRVLPPDKSNNPPPLDANGYPAFVTILGDSLERSLNQYGQMNYPVTSIPKDTDNNRRHRIYVSSGPIWTDIPIVGGGYQFDMRGVTLPNRMFINHNVPYTTTQTVQIDPLRAETGAHELFHTVQWTYVPGVCPVGGQVCSWGTQSDLRWWMEATAQWAQPKVYPQCGTYPMFLDSLLKESYRSMSSTGGYSSVLFARHLEGNVAFPSNPNTASDIIRATWQRYKDINGNNQAGKIIEAIDTVIGEYNGTTNLANEFPKFTWNNYFMITGTYGIQVTNVYTDLVTLPPSFTGPEWKLFRNFAQEDRKKWQDGNAGVNPVARVFQFPVDVSPGTTTAIVDHWGAGYLEFFPSRLNLQTGQTADLNLTIVVGNGNVIPQADRPRVSIMPITAWGGNTLPPPNDFVQPVLSGGALIYNRNIPNFNTYNRVAVIINNISQHLDGIPYGYSANVVIR
jgi:uncharacterized repeat protein (TIGR01451 family)